MDLGVENMICRRDDGGAHLLADAGGVQPGRRLWVGVLHLVHVAQDVVVLPRVLPRLQRRHGGVQVVGVRRQVGRQHHGDRQRVHGGAGDGAADEVHDAGRAHLGSPLALPVRYQCGIRHGVGAVAVEPRHGAVLLPQVVRHAVLTPAKRLADSDDGLAGHGVDVGGYLGTVKGGVEHRREARVGDLTRRVDAELVEHAHAVAGEPGQALATHHLRAHQRVGVRHGNDQALTFGLRDVDALAAQRAEELLKRDAGITFVLAAPAHLDLQRDARAFDLLGVGEGRRLRLTRRVEELQASLDPLAVRRLHVDLDAVVAVPAQRDVALIDQRGHLFLPAGQPLLVRLGTELTPP